MKPWPPLLCYISHIAFFKATVLTCGFSLQVLPSPSPSLYKDATHLFADFTRLKPGDFRVDVSVASNQGVTCLKPEYIADYLMQVGGWILDWITTFYIMSLLCLCKYDSDSSVKVVDSKSNMYFFLPLQEPTPPIELYYLTVAATEEPPGTPSRKRKAVVDNSRLKKTRLN